MVFCRCRLSDQHTRCYTPSPDLPPKPLLHLLYLLYHTQVTFHSPLPVPVADYTMLTRLDLQIERFPMSFHAQRIIKSADVFPPGLSLPNLSAASFTGGHQVGVEMQASDIAAFAPALQQLSVWTLRIKPAGPAGGTAGSSRDGAATAAASSPASSRD